MNGLPQITVRAIVLGALTIAANFYYIVNVGQRLGIGSYVHSQFPMATFMPFVLWLFLNTALRALWPRVALSRGEMLTLFSMLWVVGTIPQLGWMTYWTSIVGAPSYFATAENQWEELFFDYLPWHVFANASPRVVDPFWFGLSEGASIPWDGWIGAIGQWLGVSMAMVVFGFCLIALFHKQWVEAEKLTFPLAQMPLDLTQGFEGKRWPELFCKPVFWIGFALVFLPILYNIATYFALGLPPIEFYWKFYDFHATPDFFLTVRVLPLIMAVTYLCPVDILGSMIFFHLLAALKIALMKRTGFSIGGFAVGAAGQQPEAQNIIYMESYGALVFIGLWSIWLARRHLRQVWHQVRSGQGEPRQVALYRLALAGLILSGLSVIGWGVQLGMSLPVSIGGFLLMTLTYFVIAKLVAATGFAYLLPNKPHIKGDSFLIELVGSAFQSPRSLVAFKVFTSNAFFGTFRIPAWPALPHCFRLFSLERQPGRLTAMVLIAFPIGFVVLAVETISLAYEGGGLIFLGGKANWIFEDMVYLLNNPMLPDLNKWAVWFFGFGEAALIALLRGYFHWFPLHPIGLAFQHTFGLRLYWFSLFIVWVVKIILLRYGGVKAYIAGKPLFYGLAIGYVVGVVFSMVVDLIWFPAEGHSMHGW